MRIKFRVDTWNIMLSSFTPTNNECVSRARKGRMICSDRSRVKRNKMGKVMICQRDPCLRYKCSTRNTSLSPWILAKTWLQNDPVVFYVEPMCLSSIRIPLPSGSDTGFDDTWGKINLFNFPLFYHMIYI